MYKINLVIWTYYFWWLQYRILSKMLQAGWSFVTDPHFVFWWVCATWVSKSRVYRVDFPWKMRGHRNKNLCLESCNFGQNEAEKCNFTNKNLKLGGYIPYHFPMWVPPPPRCSIWPILSMFSFWRAKFSEKTSAVKVRDISILIGNHQLIACSQNVRGQARLILMPSASGCFVKDTSVILLFPSIFTLKVVVFFIFWL